MRRIDNMTKEEISDFYEGMLKDGCTYCPVYKECHNERCDVVAHRYLFKEIPVNSRWQLCNSDEDFEALWGEFLNNPALAHSATGLYCYLTQKVEVNE